MASAGQIETLRQKVVNSSLPLRLDGQSYRIATSIADAGVIGVLFTEGLQPVRDVTVPVERFDRPPEVKIDWPERNRLVAFLLIKKLLGVESTPHA